MLDRKIEANIDGNGNVVIQNSDSSTITVNVGNPEEVNKALLNLQDCLEKIPLKVIEKLMENKTAEVPCTGANIYLSVNFMFETMCGSPTGRISGISFGVTVTNTTKENRFFQEPSFKVSTPIEGHLDTFMMTEAIGQKPTFPKKLEYGEPFTVYYNIPNMRLFRQLIEKDENVTIKSFTNTTLGEVYFSNEYKLKDLLKDEKYMAQNPMM